MENKKFNVNTTLKITEFLMLVDDLVDGFFTDNLLGGTSDNYSPHIGKLNAMRLFYNLCITDDDYQIEHNVADPLVLEDVFQDKDFLKAFNDALDGYDPLDESWSDSGLNFAAAYECAKDIVRYKTESPIAAIDAVKNSILQAIDKANDILSSENIEALKNILSSVNFEALTSGE